MSSSDFLVPPQQFGITPPNQLPAPPTRMGTSPLLRSDLRPLGKVRYPLRSDLDPDSPISSSNDGTELPTSDEDIALSIPKNENPSQIPAITQPLTSTPARGGQNAIRAIGFKMETNQEGKDIITILPKINEDGSPITISVEELTSCNSTDNVKTCFRFERGNTSDAVEWLNFFYSKEFDKAVVSIQKMPGVIEKVKIALTLPNVLRVTGLSGKLLEIKKIIEMDKSLKKGVLDSIRSALFSGKSVKNADVELEKYKSAADLNNPITEVEKITETTPLDQLSQTEKKLGSGLLNFYRNRIIDLQRFKEKYKLNSKKLELELPIGFNEVPPISIDGYEKTLEDEEKYKDASKKLEELEELKKNNNPSLYNKAKDSTYDKIKKIFNNPKSSFVSIFTNRKTGKKGGKNRKTKKLRTGDLQNR
jgi:hypothetical protein